MNNSLLLLLGNLPSSICVIGAVYLMANDKSGWGWLIFAALMLHSSIKIGAK